MNFQWWHIILALLPILPSFWGIWDIWNHSFITQERKMMWLLLVVFVPVIGGIVYIILGRKQAMPKI